MGLILNTDNTDETNFHGSSCCRDGACSVSTKIQKRGMFFRSFHV